MRVSVRSACWTSSSVSRRYVAPGVFLSPKSGRRYHTSAYMERLYRFQSIRVGRLFQYYGVHIAPLFVKLNEQIEGLTYLLTLGVRVLTVTEFVLRRSLEQAQASLPSLHPENKQKMTDKPTAERILQAFADISLTIIKNAAGEEILRRLTPLSGLQEDILQRLGLGTTLYGQLEIQVMGT